MLTFGTRRSNRSLESRYSVLNQWMRLEPSLCIISGTQRYDRPTIWKVTLIWTTTISNSESLSAYKHHNRILIHGAQSMLEPYYDAANPTSTAIRPRPRKETLPMVRN